MSFSANPLNQIIEGDYNGYPYGLGETVEHVNTAPQLFPIDGKIVVLVVGASGPKSIASRWANIISEKQSLGQVSNNVILINGCVPSTGINRWRKANDSVWDNASDALTAAGFSFTHVQVLFTTQDDIDDNNNELPSAINSLKSKMMSFLNVASNKMPNLRQIHLMSRTYTGWANNPAHDEPAAYHTGIVNKLITQDCINGLFGPYMFINDGCYLWSDGDTQRNDGFQITQADFDKGASTDYIHLNTTGNTKLANFAHNYALKFSFYQP